MSESMKQLILAVMCKVTYEAPNLIAYTTGTVEGLDLNQDHVHDLDRMLISLIACLSKAVLFTSSFVMVLNRRELVDT